MEQCTPIYPFHMYSFYGTEEFVQHEQQRVIEWQERMKLEKKLKQPWQVKHPLLRTLCKQWLYPKLTKSVTKLEYNWVNSELCILNKIFSKQFCENLIDESNNLVQSNHPYAQLDLTGIDLLMFGFEHLFQNFTLEILPSIIDKISTDSSNWNINYKDLYVFHAFVIYYNADNKQSKKHPIHVDDSYLTLNICLGGNFTGGNLRIYENDSSISFPQSQGQLFLHPGNLNHSADKITSGERYNLVIWFKEKKNIKIPTNNNNTLSLSDLPKEILFYIFNFLDTKTLCKISVVNKHFLQISRDNYLWKDRYDRFVKPVHKLLSIQEETDNEIKLNYNFWYKKFQTSRQTYNYPFIEGSLPKVNFTFLNTLINSERKFIQKLKNLLHFLKTQKYHDIYELVKPLLKIHWQIFGFFTSFLLDSAFKFLFDNIKFIINFCSFIRNENFCQSVHVDLCEIPMHIIQYYEICYSFEPLLMNNIKPTKNSMFLLKKISFEIQPNEISWSCNFCNKIKFDKFERIANEFQTTEKSYRELFEYATEKPISIMVLIAQHCNFSANEINDFIDCLNECKTLKKLSLCFEKNFSIILNKQNSSLDIYLNIVQLLVCFTQFILSSSSPYYNRWMKREENLDKWMNNRNFLTKYENNYNPHENPINFGLRPYLATPCKRIPRYALLVNEMSRNNPHSQSLSYLSSEYNDMLHLFGENIFTCAEFGADMKQLFSRTLCFVQPENLSIGNSLSASHLNFKIPGVYYFFNAVYLCDFDVVEKFLQMNLFNPNIAIWWKPNSSILKDDTKDVFASYLDRFYQGTTALFIASAVGSFDICELLLSYGAHPSIPRYCGSTPWSVARVKGHTKICELVYEWESKNIFFSSKKFVPWLMRFGNEVHSSELFLNR